MTGSRTNTLMVLASILSISGAISSRAEETKIVTTIDKTRVVLLETKENQMVAWAATDEFAKQIGSALHVSGLGPVRVEEIEVIAQGRDADGAYGLRIGLKIGSMVPGYDGIDAEAIVKQRIDGGKDFYVAKAVSRG